MVLESLDDDREADDAHAYRYGDDVHDDRMERHAERQLHDSDLSDRDFLWLDGLHVLAEFHQGYDLGQIRRIK